MTTDTVNRKAHIGKLTTISLFTALLLSFLAWQLLRPEGFSGVVLAVQIIPLVVFIPALKNNNPRAYIGLCFVLLLYFIKGVEGVFHPARAWIDISILSISVILFISSMMTSRWLQQVQNKTVE